MADEQASDDSSIEEIVNRVLAINHELASFSSLLQSLPQVIVITKRDLWISRWSNAAALHERVKEALAKTKSLLQPALAVTSLSTATGDGVGDLIILAWKALAGKAD